jgi:alkylation response protein AidB-like acyl-CoA dehydrogenase
VAMGAYRAATNWAFENGFLGGSPNKSQEVKFALADLKARILSARLLLYVTAQLVDTAGDDDITSSVSMAKLVCTDTAMSVALDAMELLGPDGDRPELEVERFVRDAKVLQIYDGTNQIQRFLISRDLFEEE